MLFQFTSQRKRQSPTPPKVKGERPGTQFGMHFHLTTTARARTNETQRFPGYGGLPKGDLTPPTSDVYIHINICVYRYIHIHITHNVGVVHLGLFPRMVPSWSLEQISLLNPVELCMPCGRTKFRSTRTDWLGKLFDRTHRTP